MKNIISGFYRIAVLLVLVFTSFASHAFMQGIQPTSMPISETADISSGAGIFSQDFSSQGSIFFSRNLSLGSVGEDVYNLQKWLNEAGISVVLSGAGSPGMETRTYGPATKNAVIRFQEANSGDILIPLNLSKGTGVFANSTRAVMNSLVSKSGVVLGATDPESFWTSSSVPQTVHDPDSTAVEVGMKWSSKVSGNVTGIKFYKGPQNTGTHTGTLWNGNGTKLAEGTFSGETSSGWQTLIFGNPVHIEANTTYVVSYNAPVGKYSTNQYYFTSKRTSGNIVTQRNAGVYRYGEKALPNQSWHSSNYWVDVIFSPDKATETGGDTSAPVVYLSGPNGTVSGKIDIMADASDNTGVAGVQFYLDGWVLESEDTLPPYSVSWDTATDKNGVHTLYARARDTAGNSTTSPTITVTVNNTTGNPDKENPSVSFVSPSQNGSISGSAANISVSASDNVGVAGVQFKLGTQFIGAEDTVSPYSLAWDTTVTANGTYTLSAIARDVAGNTSIATRNIVINNYVPPAPDTILPTVSFTAPSNNSNVAGAAVGLSASATDDTGVVGVTFKYGSSAISSTNLIGAEDMTSPYSTNWNTLDLSNGSYVLSATARDLAGNTAVATRTITINNPVPDITAPSVPTGLEGVSVSETQVNLTWTSSIDTVGVTGYKIFRNGTQIATSAVNSYSVTGLTADTTYSFTVSAYDMAGNNSGQSASVSIRTKASVVPPSTIFMINDRVYVASGPLNVRATASSTGTLLGTQAINAVGTVVGGPVAQGDLVWWNIDYDTGVDGWSAENYLAEYVGPATGDTTPVGNLTGVATYQSLGLYMPSASGTVTALRYRSLSSSEWKNALPLWLGSGNQYRGSIMDLNAGTQYVVEATNGSTVVGRGTFTTWTESSNLPIASTTVILSQSGTYTISTSGTATGYRLYTGNGVNTIDMGLANNQNAPSCIDVDASYVIIRAMKLVNCKGSGIKLGPNVHHVIIEGNDIVGFGYSWGNLTPVGPGETSSFPGKAENEKFAGIFCPESKETPCKVSQITIQGNKIREQRYGSNPWGTNADHPYGGNAIGFFNGDTGGNARNNVFRYNDILGSQGHYFMDGIGGGNNFTATGFPNADSDIIGNYISRVYDDCIEAEGGNMNVRVMRNYLTNCYISIANGAVAKGPIYNIRNISGTRAGVYAPEISNYDGTESERGTFFKLGSQNSSYNGGKGYYFNNTTLQPRCPNGSSNTCGIEVFMQNSAGDEIASPIESANNIFSSFINSNGGTEDVLGYRMSCDGTLRTWANELIENGSITVSGCLTKVSGNGKAIYNSNVDEALEAKSYPPDDGKYRRAYVPQRTPNQIGDFSLKAGSPGKGTAKPIANVTDMFSSPDVGAHQSGTGSMLFGTALWTGTKAY